MDTLPSSAPPSQSHNALERITLQMASCLDLQLVLTTITQGLVDELDGAFTRIWLLGLAISAPTVTKLPIVRIGLAVCILRRARGSIPTSDGEYRRIPLGALKIRKIAQGFGSVYTNDVLGDDRLPNKQWMKDNGLHSFAGHPLMFRGELLGVVAIFGRRPLSEKKFTQLAVFANKAAIATRNAHRSSFFLLGLDQVVLRE